MSFYRENNILIVGATSGPLSEEVIGESVDSEAASLSSSHAWRYTYQVSHCRIFSIINNLDKIEVKIEDENQAFLLLYSLPSSYKSFRNALIYGGKSTIKVNEVKEYLLNKDKIDNQLTNESHHDDSRQVHFSKEKSNNESFTGNLKYKNLVCSWCHKKGHIRADCWIRKKK